MRPKKLPHKLPVRSRYKLEQAAEIAGCSVDDLLHWGAEGIINLLVYVDGLFWHLDDAPPILGARPSDVVNGDREAWGTIGANPDDSAGYEALSGGDQFELFGWWELTLWCIADIETRGCTIENHAIIVRLPGANIPGFMTGVPNRRLTTTDLNISAKELDRLISGEIAEMQRTESPVHRMQRKLHQHGNAERFAANRETVLKAAIYCMTKWPERCATGAREWARAIEEKAGLFWPQTGVPPLGLDSIERLLGQAQKLPRDVE